MDDARWVPADDDGPVHRQVSTPYGIELGNPADPIVLGGDRAQQVKAGT